MGKPEDEKGATAPGFDGMMKAMTDAQSMWMQATTAWGPRGGEASRPGGGSGPMRAASDLWFRSSAEFLDKVRQATAGQPGGEIVGSVVQAQTTCLQMFKSWSDGMLDLVDRTMPAAAPAAPKTDPATDAAPRSKK